MRVIGIYAGYAKGWQEYLDHLALREANVDQVTNAESSLYQHMKELREEINQSFEGKDRLWRPPLFCWMDTHFPLGRFASAETIQIKDKSRLLSGTSAAETAFMKSQSGPGENLKVMAVTYNMQGKIFEESNAHQLLEDIFQLNNSAHDIYVIGTQEAEHGICYSVLYNNRKDKLNQFIRSYFNAGKDTLFQEQTKKGKSRSKDSNQSTQDNYNRVVDEDKQFVVVQEVSSGASSLTVLVRKKYAKWIKNIESDTLAIGKMYAFQNKTAIKINFNLGNQRVLFINCHLDPHLRDRIVRQEQWHYICAKFVSKKKMVETDLGKLSQEAQNQEVDRNWDTIIWLGDMNSRLADKGSKDSEKRVQDAISNADYTDLISHDHLLLDNFDPTKYGNAAFYKFREGSIKNFAPSYKLAGGTDHYSKKRIPAWTDRIIYRSTTAEGEQGSLTLVNYDSNNLLCLSDHRPVFAQFLLRVDGVQNC